MKVSSPQPQGAESCLQHQTSAGLPWGRQVRPPPLSSGPRQGISATRVPPLVLPQPVSLTPPLAAGHGLQDTPVPRGTTEAGGRGGLPRCRAQESPPGSCFPGPPAGIGHGPGRSTRPEAETLEAHPPTRCREPRKCWRLTTARSR